MARWERVDRKPWPTRADQLRAGDCWLLADGAIDCPKEVTVLEVGRDPRNGTHTVRLATHGGAVVYLPPDSMVDVVAHRREYGDDTPGDPDIPVDVVSDRSAFPGLCRVCFPDEPDDWAEGLCLGCQPQPPLARGPIATVRRLLGLG